MVFNQNKFDAEFCGKVPLHQTNLIQPHGYLLIIDRQTLDILQASENLAEFLNSDISQIVQGKLNDFFSEETVSVLRNFASGNITTSISIESTIHASRHLLMARIPGSGEEKSPDETPFFFLEIEKNPVTASARLSVMEMYRHLGVLMDAVSGASTVEEVCSIAASELKNISGFDKVMIYGFDDNWNGDVIAEAMEDGMETYLGLKFPASDIPPQAREMYKKTPYRLIPDVNYEPVKLYPVINPRGHVFTDLTDSNFRSVAGVHLEYLRNMGVVASMSTRIIVNGSLWGLISCHHRHPKYPDVESRSIFELVSSVISERISSMTTIQSLRFEGQNLRSQISIMEDLYRNQPGILPTKDLRNILNCGGVAIILHGEIQTSGLTPPKSDIEELVRWLSAMGIKTLYTQESLGNVYEPFLKHASIASGLLVLPLHPESMSYILAFRPEEIQQVNWGGNPHEAIRFENDGKKYHPRASFETWQQTLTGTAVSWTADEMEMAGDLRQALSNFLFNKTDG